MPNPRRHWVRTPFSEIKVAKSGRIQPGVTYAPALVFDANHNELVQQVKLYLPARTAMVLARV